MDYDSAQDLIGVLSGIKKSINNIGEISDLTEVLQQIRDELCVMNVPQELRSSQRVYMAVEFLLKSNRRDKIMAIQDIGREKQKYPNLSDEEFNNLPEIIKLKNQIKTYEKDIENYEAQIKQLEALGCHSY
jgi:hypothetical protein